jgi:hypothetical protein
VHAAVDACSRVAYLEVHLDELARIQVPTLVVHGTEDPVYPYDHAEVLAKASRRRRWSGGRAWATNNLRNSSRNLPDWSSSTSTSPAEPLTTKETRPIGPAYKRPADRAPRHHIWAWCTQARMLDPEYLPAVDSPDPGGLDPKELAALLAALSPAAVGAQVTVFDPDLDPDGRYAHMLTDVLATGLGHLGTARTSPG